MTIEIKEKGSRKFYKEVVNVLTQYRQLLYKPEDKLKDNFTRYILLTAVMAFLAIIYVISGSKGAFTTSKILVVVFGSLAAIASLVNYLRMNKAVNAYLADDRPSAVNLDENGIEIEKTGSQAVRLAWDNVAFVRSFSEATCFFAKDLSGIVLCVNNNYKKEVLDYIKNNGIDVKVVK